MPDLPTGTVTLLFTGIEGSAHLVQHLGKRYSVMLAKCRSLLRNAFQQHHGHVVDMQGDALFSQIIRDLVEQALCHPQNDLPIREHYTDSGG